MVAAEDAWLVSVSEMCNKGSDAQRQWQEEHRAWEQANLEWQQRKAGATDGVDVGQAPVEPVAPPRVLPLEMARDDVDLLRLMRSLKAQDAVVALRHEQSVRVRLFAMRAFVVRGQRLQQELDARFRSLVLWCKSTEHHEGKPHAPLLSNRQIQAICHAPAPPPLHVVSTWRSEDRAVLMRLQEAFAEWEEEERQEQLRLAKEDEEGRRRREEILRRKEEEQKRKAEEEYRRKHRAELEQEEEERKRREEKERKRREEEEKEEERRREEEEQKAEEEKKRQLEEIQRAQQLDEEERKRKAAEVQRA